MILPLLPPFFLQNAMFPGFQRHHPKPAGSEPEGWAVVGFRGFRVCKIISGTKDSTYSLHCSSFLGLPFRILNIELVKPKKGTTMETIGRRFGISAQDKLIYGMSSCPCECDADSSVLKPGTTSMIISFEHMHTHTEIDR